MKSWELSVSYAGERWSVEIDEVVRRAVGKANHSSGIGFGERDMQFAFGSHDEVAAAALRAKKALAEKGIDCEVESWQSEEVL